ncbi:Arc family DNA-binding protein [uncultured Nocardioides sp.]|uniref:FitA-like ribbon-helix-helix domain-containing protein n=1 Tax=uncultured Nocardioides sp. TaxID=198441 RepID=UPI00261286AA|nr:Arc family DNA-binding protein [uncultured Nocardioides sp.]
MSAITVRRLPEGVKQRLRLRAAANGRSMEAEARCILVDALHADRRVDLDWVDGLMAVGAELGGVELPEVPDDPADAARFDGP